MWTQREFLVGTLPDDNKHGRNGFWMSPSCGRSLESARCFGDCGDDTIVAARPSWFSPSASRQAEHPAFARDSKKRRVM
jgi:hypothetical protein